MATIALVQDMVIDKLERLIKPVSTLMGVNPALKNAYMHLNTCVTSIKSVLPDVENQHEETKDEQPSLRR